MFANTNNQPLPLIVVDEQGIELNTKRVKFVTEDTETTVAKVDEIYVELNDD